MSLRKYYFTHTHTFTLRETECERNYFKVGWFVVWSKKLFKKKYLNKKIRTKTKSNKHKYVTFTKWKTKIACVRLIKNDFQEMRKLQNGKEVKTWAISCQECLTEQQLRSRERETEKAK